MKKAFKRYGEENFRIELITVCSTQEIADRLESFFIVKYRTMESGYNVNAGGKTGGRKGIKHSLETRIKLAEIGRGKKLSEETKIKVSRGMRGRKLSEDHKNNLSKRRKGTTWKIVDGKRVWSMNNEK